MSGFRIPIRRTITDPDPAGPIRTVLRAAAVPFVMARSGTFIEFKPCVIDTGSSYTMMSATRARDLGIDFPPATSRLSVRTASGSGAALVHDGELRVRFPQLPGRVFRLYCLFSEALPPDTPLLLGLNNFIDLFRVTFDGRYAPDAPSGHVLLEPTAASP